MKNLKAYQRNQLICEFGILMQPLEDLSRAEQPPSLQEYRIAIAKVQAGDSAWRELAKEFTTFAPDIFFSQEYQDISHVPERCLRALRDKMDESEIGIFNIGIDSSVKLHEEFRKNLTNFRNRLFEYIDRIPIDWEPVVFEANTPFTSYLRIKEAIVSVKHRVHYFDRYLKPEFFTLFLSLVERTISVRLVTTAGNAQYGVASVFAISRLVEQEFSDYRLIEVAPNDLHDRNLRVDDQIFNLGPGVDRAGIALTNFGPSDSSSTAHDALDRLVASGRVVQ